jgi:hypothetical protein
MKMLYGLDSANPNKDFQFKPKGLYVQATTKKSVIGSRVIDDIYEPRYMG